MFTFDLAIVNSDGITGKTKKYLVYIRAAEKYQYFQTTLRQLKHFIRKRKEKKKDPADLGINRLYMSTCITLQEHRVYVNIIIIAIPFVLSVSKMNA